ncbi:Protein transport protein Sec61 subunit gamma [Acropora cervicornis]|uniref:Protein transport protein Sec61 subunit gamma n=1 Tax=Acropora cervicornis TaxID=6130 RepID=A0AAD9QZ65_ACRCE|nr:Protein transport protein Sec61 subunit gamma [Acropora cervicornis]
MLLGQRVDAGSHNATRGFKFFLFRIYPKMDQITNALQPCKQFAKDSMRLVKRCTKPDRKDAIGKNNNILDTKEAGYSINLQ